METILVTGGAGYIGSNCVRVLLDRGYSVVVLDNLSNGHISALPKNIKFIHGDLSDKILLDTIFKQNSIDAVVHFAGYIDVSESVKDPKKYFDNNYLNGLNLLEAMINNNVKKIVFSSTCAIFGNDVESHISENFPKHPINPYGLAKHMFEQTLEWYDKAYGLKSVCLRYFNAAGADFGIGEQHNVETHLIPLAIQAALGKRENIKIFGTDYPTKDGTCIRDYVHITDLSEAHVLALKHLFVKNKSAAYNLGSGNGYSVYDIIETIKKISGRNITVVIEKRREGDATILIANSSKIKRELGWKAKRSLDEIIYSAWTWHISQYY